MSVPRLYCLPFSGGSSYSYRELEAAANGRFRVEALDLAGHGRRLGERPGTSMDALVEDAIRTMAIPPGAPYALYGHSLGALLAYLVARRFREEGFPLPLHLFVSGKQGPTVPRAASPRHLLDEPAFREMLRSLGGVPEEVLGDRELMEIFLPILRADFEAVDTYRHTASPPLPIPITAFLGDRDEASPEEAGAWALETSAPFRLHVLPGDHFFVNRHWRFLCDTIADALSGVSSARGHDATRRPPVSGVILEGETA